MKLCKSKLNVHIFRRSFVIVKLWLSLNFELEKVFFKTETKT